MPHHRDVSNRLLSSLYTEIDLSSAINDVVEEEVLELLLTNLLVMNVQELALTAVDTELLEFSFKQLLLCILLS